MSSVAAYLTLGVRVSQYEEFEGFEPSVFRSTTAVSVRREEALERRRARERKAEEERCVTGGGVVCANRRFVASCPSANHAPPEQTTAQPAAADGVAAS